MKINYLTLILGLISLFIYGCKKNEVLLNDKDVLISNTWIKHSYFDSGISNEYEEFLYKDEYTFYDNGKYELKEERTFFNDQNEIIHDTVVNEHDWLFDEKNRIIDFKINDTGEGFVSQFDWEIIKLTENRIIVKNIFPFESQNDSRILLKKK